MMKKLFVLLFSFLVTAPAYAVDGVSVEYGSGSDGTKMGRVGLLWDWNKSWFNDGNAIHGIRRSSHQKGK
jgi:hypothetical protein